MIRETNKIQTMKKATTVTTPAPAPPVNPIEPGSSLQKFSLLELEQFTMEKSYSSTASKDFHLFYVGRDDVHDILKYILSRVTFSLYLNMFGYDDDDLNEIIMEKARDPHITMLITLDKSQAGGKHEAALLKSDVGQDPAAFNTHIVTGEQFKNLTEFVIGQSATHQISHTKGFVADGKVGAEGSTNWSVSGEGTFVVTGQAGGPGYKAQNNTQTVFTDPDAVARFQAELIREHMAAQAQPGGVKAKPARAVTPVPAAGRRVGL
jgi:hypothetical protein